MDVDKNEGVNNTGVGEDDGVDDEKAFAVMFERLLSRSSLSLQLRDIAQNRAKFGEKVGVQPQTVEKWEKGERVPGSKRMAAKIATALELLPKERRELFAAWQRAREAHDGRVKKAPAPSDAATFTGPQALQDTRAVRLPRPTRLRPPVVIITVATALTLVVVAVAFALTHRSPLSTPTHRLVTRGFASVTKSGPCRFYVNLTVPGLPPHAHVTLSSDYIGHKCSDGTAYQGTWHKSFGKVGSSGTWSYPLLQQDYGTYRYTVVTDAGTRTSIDLHYGPQGNA